MPRIPSLRPLTGLLCLLLVAALGAPASAADLFVSHIVVEASGKDRPAGEKIRFVAPVQQRMGEDVGLYHAMINPDRTTVTSPDGELIDVEIEPVRIAGSDKIGARFAFDLPKPIDNGQAAVFTVVFEEIGTELLSNNPDLKLEPVEPTWGPDDFARAERGQSWDFNRDGPPRLEQNWHTTVERTDEGHLVATADGKYSSPVIGYIPGPIDGRKYPRLVIRARREGPTAGRGILVNNKTSPRDHNGQAALEETFDLYTVDLTGRPNWGPETERLALRWTHGENPTAQDRIIIDWIRLYPTRHFVYFDTVRPALPNEKLGRPVVTLPVKVVENRPRREAADPARPDFFRPAPDRGEDLPQDRIYPKGRLFPLSLYSVGGGTHKRDTEGNVLPAVKRKQQAIADALQRVKEDGFTMIGPQYELNHRILEDAKSVDLKCVYTLGTDEKGGQWTNFVHEHNTDVDPADVKRRAIAQVRAVAEETAIAWWNITPEEIRWWRTKEMAYMRAMYEAVKEADPYDRPVYMYEPNNRSADALVKTLQNQDICGKGSYTNYAGQRDARVWVRWSVSQSVEACRRIGRDDVLPIVVPEMFQQPPDELVDRVGTWARHDAWLGLVSGAKGMIVFSMRQRDGFTAHHDYYEGYATVARDLTGPAKLGRVLLFGDPRADLGVTMTEGPATVMLADNFGSRLGYHIQYPSIAIRELAFGRARYFFAVNSADEPVKAVLEGLPKRPVRVEDAFAPGDARTVESGSLEVSFEPLGVRAWKITEPR